MQEPRYIVFEQTLKAIQKKHPKFKFIQKKHSRWSKFLSFFVFWTNYMRAWTASYPNILAPDVELDKQIKPEALQHEWVHFLDQKTLFGLLSFLPGWLNWFLFGLAYLTPQVFALAAVGAIWNLWWLLALLFLLPFPSPLRTYAELRGYRRTKEFGVPIEKIVPVFTGKSYYFMCPFPKYVAKELEKDSPYKETMDEARKVD